MAKLLMIQQQIAPYAGIAYLNGSLKTSGHKLVVHLGSKIDKILEVIKHKKPDLIGFSCITGLHVQAIEISKEIKKNIDIPVIMGGPHATLFPDVLHDPHIDMICRGEGEFAIVDLLDKIDKKESVHDVMNIWSKRNGGIIQNEMRPYSTNTDDVPLIDWTCYEGTAVQKHSPTAFLIRGCPYACTYCFNEGFRKMTKNLGKNIRAFSVERSIQEIQQALNFFNPNPVVFTSDTFGIDLKWMDELLERYTQITDLPFVMQLRPELATKKTIDILEKYKCYSVAIGLESGNERVRRDILNRKYSNEMLMTIAENLHNAGIKFRTYNIIGIPTETDEELWETIELNIKMKTDYPRASIFSPYPETKIVKIAIEHGFLDDNFTYDAVSDSVLSHSVLKNIDHNKLLNTLYFFQTIVVYPRFKEFLRKFIRFRANFIFRMWFSFMYLLLLKKSEDKKLLPFVRYLISYAIHK